MNQIIRTIALSAGLLGLITTQLHANPARGSVMVLAKENVEEEKNKSKNGGTQTITIDITVNGKPKDPETRIIKWTAWGKDQKSGEFVTMESGEIPLNLSAGSTQKTSTKKLTTTYKEKQTVANKKSTNNRQGTTQQIKYTEVPGEGVKYYGYGVEVLDGGVVIGSKFDPRTLEKKK